MKYYLRTSGIVILILLMSGFAWSQDIVEPPVEVTAELSMSGLVAGSKATFAVIFNTPENHHITDPDFGLWYVEMEWPEGITVVDTVYPEGIIDKNGDKVFRGVSPVLFNLEVTKDLKPGNYELNYSYSYQICRELEPESCFLPNGGEGTFDLSILPPGKTAIPSQNTIFGTNAVDKPAISNEKAEGKGLENKLNKALESGSFGAFFLVFLAGILVSFTPCVYPMIPIIIGFVGGGAGGSRSKGFLLSVFFVLGLCITYAILGVVAGATGALFGAFMSNPIVLWIIVFIFVALGFSMLGFFDIALPASIQGKLMAGQRQGIIGAVIMGGVTGIVAAPCAGPPLLVLLGWIGNTGNLVLGFFLMATFALGIGVLFIVIGTFAGAMTAMPQAGPWMDNIKKGLGIVIFAVALYYLGLLLPETIVTMITGAFLLLVGLFMGAFANWENLSKLGKYGKGLGILLVLAGSFHFLLGLAELKGVKLDGFQGNSQSNQNMAQDTHHVPWRVNEHDAVIAQAGQEGKPVLIDFYADWCGVCVELDHKVWTNDEVIKATSDFLTLKLDFTRADPELEALRKSYGVGGLPVVMILGPDQKERSRFSAFKSPTEVIEWLKEHK